MHDCPPSRDRSDRFRTPLSPAVNLLDATHDAIIVDLLLDATHDTIVVDLLLDATHDTIVVCHLLETFEAFSAGVGVGVVVVLGVGIGVDARFDRS